MYCPFIKYKHIFGIPGKGLHRFRIFNTALIDYILTIALALILTHFTGIPLVINTILSFVLGIVFHILFGVQTNTLSFLGINCK